MVRSTSRNRNAASPNREPVAPAVATQVAPQTQVAAAVAAETQAETTQTNLPTTIEQRSLATPAARNAFESYGQSMSISSITGTLIKFNKGDWVTGEDEDLDVDDLELVANMDQLMVGWIKWVDNRPAEQIMGPVSEGYQPPRRNDLGDQDQGAWEVDDQGRARDPWQFSNYIVLKAAGEAATDDNLFTFATSSKGGLGAIGALCRAYGKEMRVRPDDYPVVKLGSDSYNHREFGRTKVPVISIVAWEPKSSFTAPTAAPAPAAREEAPARAPAGRRAGGRAA